MSLNTGRLAARTDELERHTEKFAIPTPRFARKFSTWNPSFHAEEAYPQNCMVQQPRNQVSDMHFDKYPKLDSARKLRGIYFTDPEDGELKETIQNARKKLVEAAMPCKMGTQKRSHKSRVTDDETKGSNKIQNTRHACIVEDH